MGLRNLRRVDLTPGNRLSNQQAAGPWIYVGQRTSPRVDDLGVTDQWYLHAASEVPLGPNTGPPSIDDYLPGADYNNTPGTPGYNGGVFTVSYQGIPFTVESPVFQNSWTQLLGTEEYFSFRYVPGHAPDLRGGIQGGASGTVVFTFPVNYRIPRDVHFTSASTDPTIFSTWLIAANGDVTVWLS